MEDPLTFCLAAATGSGVEVTRHERFATGGAQAYDEAVALWRDFADDGRLDNGSLGVGGEPTSRSGEAIGAAVAARVRLEPGQTRELAFTLAWDMPIARFGAGRGWYRRYTKFYGRSGDAAPALARDALRDYASWEKEVEAWQRPVLEDPDLPDWYKATLFNETYYLVDGGTVWTAGEAPAIAALPPAPLPEPEIGHFGYLESHEYLMYNTYDVHFSASFALAMLWPELELGLQRDFARTVAQEDPTLVSFIFSGHRAPRKVRGVVPHDLGAPQQDPWVRTNAYNAQDISRWKDLNPKFVLQVYRDYVLTRDKAFLAEVWPAVAEAMAYMYRFDRDRDGLIENEGYPDQTYDVWSASGPSAYSGGLWLASLAAAAAMAAEMRQAELERNWRSDLERGRAAYEDRLWNGTYYDYDASPSRHHTSIMADMLAGNWFALACGLEPVVPFDRGRSALDKIFEMNVMDWSGGIRGAVNGMRPDGWFDRTCMQSAEVWTGTTFSLAAAMLQFGLTDKAFTTAQGVYLSVYRDYPLWFQTPEALSVDGVYRALAYMRPLAVWSMQWELERRDSD